MHTQCRFKKRYAIEEAGSGNLKEFVLYFKPFRFKLLNRFFHFFNYYKLARLACHKSGKPEIVHLQVMYRMVIIAWFFKFIYRAPLVITEHWHGFLDGTFEKESALLRQSVKAVLAQAAMVTTVSLQLKNALVKFVDDKKVRIVPNVCNTGLVRDNLFSKAVNALIVADLDDRIKNISGVIEVVNKLYNSGLNKGFCLTILGNGKDKEMLENKATQLSKSEIIRFVGMQTHETTLDYIASCDFLIVNSMVETFSLVTLEAILSGIPVIATRCGGPEQFVNNKNGMLIEANNPEQLESALITMINSYKNYTKEEVRASVNNIYSPVAIGKEFDRIYRS
ncbi:MAG: glycosyltransferase [Bacteroidetes bacterium]|nr:glycosyltransferase [Bacteroidota bacterium]